jgi:hypothetical protein
VNGFIKASDSVGLGVVPRIESFGAPALAISV